MDEEGKWPALRRRTPKQVRRAAWWMLRTARRERPALLMRYGLSVAPPEIAAPAGYELRAWRPGDDGRWVDLMNASGAFGRWDRARLSTETRGLLRETQSFAVQGERLVAATGILDRPLSGRPALELAWVVRDPAHSGKQLGTSAMVRALRAALALPGGRPVYLYTDAHRLTAIRIYLDFGFVPDLTSHRSYPLRWEAVFRDLAVRGSSPALSVPPAADGGGERPASRPGQ